MAKFTQEDYMMPFEAAGLEFRNQFVVASGPTTKHISQLMQAEEFGWGAASLKLAIEPAPYINRKPRYKFWKDEGYLAFSAETRLVPDELFTLLAQGRKKTKELKLFANITYVGEKGMDGWVSLAKRCVDAGAHAIELNMCCPNMSFNIEASGEEDRTPKSGASLGQNAEIVGAATKIIADAVDVPIFVKITPEGGNIGQVGKACFDNGADVVASVANRLAIPDFDITNPAKGPYKLQHEPAMSCFSGEWIKPLALSDVFKIRKACGPDSVILGTGGITNYVDSIQMMMCGADMIGICTETMKRGFDFLPPLIKKIKQFMSEQGYKSCRDFRDKEVEAITTADKFTIDEAYARVDTELCTGCGRCIKIGHCYAIEMVDKKAIINPELCTACSTCMDFCPADAISFVTIN